MTEALAALAAALVIAGTRELQRWIDARERRAGRRKTRRTDRGPR